MALTETVNHLNLLLGSIAKDLNKVGRGNKSAAQRVRVGTIHLERVGKQFRKESVAAEKNGKKKLILKAHQKKKKKKK
jgi:hypothetical protein